MEAIEEKLEELDFLIKKLELKLSKKKLEEENEEECATSCFIRN